MFLTDTYKIEKSGDGTWHLKRAIYPRLYWFWGITLVSAAILFFIWNRPGWEPYEYFFGGWIVLMALAIPYHVLRDKLITIENDGAEFVLRGKHFRGNQGKRFSTEGVFRIGKVTMSDGATAKNYLMEVKTEDGLRFTMGTSSLGSMKKQELMDLGTKLEQKTRGNLKYVPLRN
jgi:hypothetical protein